VFAFYDFGISGADKHSNANDPEITVFGVHLTMDRLARGKVQAFSDRDWVSRPPIHTLSCLGEASPDPVNIRPPVLRVQ